MKASTEGGRGITFNYVREVRIIKGGLFVALLVFCFQCPDIKIGAIKVSELLLLSMAFPIFWNSPQMNTINFWFLRFFFLLLVFSLIVNVNTHFFISPALSKFNQPYFISFARFTEIFCCIVFSEIVYRHFKRLGKEDSLKVLYKLLRVQVYVISPLLLITYLLYAACVLHLHSRSGFLVYNSTYGYSDKGIRLKGFFNEGGPFGVFLAWLYILFNWFLDFTGKKGVKGLILLFVLVVFCAQSKAGIALLSLWYGYKLLVWAYKSRYRKLLIYAVAPLVAVGISFIVYRISLNYLRSFNQLRAEASSANPFVNGNMMGRVSGAVIVKNMVEKETFTGIGLGNYPLRRNDPAFRGWLPAIPSFLWDAHGYGGFVDILVDGGIIFFLLFIALIFIFFKRIRRTERMAPLVIAFAGPFLCGLQIHFLYPWFIVGLGLALSKHHYQIFKKHNQ